MLTNKEIIKKSIIAANNRIKCECGHSISFLGRNKYTICSWCGRKIYKNSLEEFKDKLKKKGIKIYE